MALHQAVIKRRDIYEIDPLQVAVQDGWNPRNGFDPEKDPEDMELVESIFQNGVYQPITVRNVGGALLIVDGWRRYNAVMLARKRGAEIVSIPAIMARKNISDSEAMIGALNSNTGKKLLPSEEAEAFSRLVAWGLNPQEIARRVGKSHMTVVRRLELVDAAPEVKADVDTKAITQAEAKTIVKDSEGNIDAQREALKQKKVEKKEKKATVATAKLKRTPASASQLSGGGGNQEPEQVNEDSRDSFKMLNKAQVEKLITERKSILNFSDDWLRHVNRGIILGLESVLYGVPEIGPIERE